jgi:hypothetical protein
MIHNRSAQLAYVTHENMPTVRHWLEEAARTANLGLYIHTQPGSGWFSDCLLVKVDIWSGDEGAVDDCYRTFLAPLERGASAVRPLAMRYIDRVTRWCEGVNRYFEARAHGFHCHA